MLWNFSDARMVLRGPVRRERTFPRPLHRHHQPEMLTHGFMLLTQISDPAAEIEVRQTTVRFGRVCSCSRRTGVESDVVVFCFRSSCVPIMLFRTPRCLSALPCPPCPLEPILKKNVLRQRCSKTVACVEIPGDRSFPKYSYRPVRRQFGRTAVTWITA